MSNAMMETPELLKKAYNEIRNKIEAAEKKYDDLKKQISNLETDIAGLKANKKELENENAKTKNDIKKTIDEAFTGTRKELKKKEEELDGLRHSIVIEKTTYGDKLKVLSEGIKNNEKKEAGLNDLIKKQEYQTMAAIELKKRLESLVKTILEELNGQNG